MDESIWLGLIVPNKVYTPFQKQPLYVADKRIELVGISLDAGYIYLTIEWYDHINGISGSYLIYRLYCYHPPQVQSHTNLVHGNISMTNIYRTELP